MRGSKGTCMENGRESHRKTLTALAIILGVGVAGFATAANAQSVDIEEIFWCDEDIGPLGTQTEEECKESRDLLLSECTSCHTFAPIVLGEKTSEEWDGFLSAHRMRVEGIDDDVFDQLKEFIGTRFTPDHPVPDLPPALRNYTLPEA